jgi:ribosome-binding factor A
MGEAIRDEVITILEGELGDPRIGLVSVTEVHMSPDGRSARVIVSVLGDEEEAARTMEGLLNARSYIRRELADHLRLRQAPELHFELDRSNQHGSRIEELLARIKKKNR